MTAIQNDKVTELKQQIKEIVEIQIKEKAILRKPHDDKTWITMLKTHERAWEITLLLNRYNELRNEPYRHATDKIPQYFTKRIKKKYPETFEC